MRPRKPAPLSIWNYKDVGIIRSEDLALLGLEDAQNLVLDCGDRRRLSALLLENLELAVVRGGRQAAGQCGALTFMPSRQGQSRVDLALR